MQFSDTLKRNYEFRRLYNRGKSAALPCLVVYARRVGGGYNRVGFTVSNKLGKAVVRNKVRRRLREIYRLNETKLKRGYELVIVARGRSVEADYWRLEREYLDACTRLGLLREDLSE